ncbi:MAG: hypothetical protein QME58_13670 [Bacteroidota bacterium]|nr:hypothetical protein [Bacteroidota bacterium]
MIKDYAIKLNGVTIPNVQEVRVRIETPGDSRGIYREPTFAATINITRDASNNAIVEAFGMATNEDGRKNILTSGTIECHGDDIKDNYAFEIKKAFISRWALKNPIEPQLPTLESFEIKVGELDYKAGGKGAKFALKAFK